MASWRLAENIQRPPNTEPAFAQGYGVAGSPTPNGKELAIRSWSLAVEAGVSPAFQIAADTAASTDSLQIQGSFAEGAAESYTLKR